MVVNFTSQNQPQIKPQKAKVYFKGSSFYLDQVRKAAAESLLQKPAVEKNILPSRFTLGTEVQPQDLDKQPTVNIDPRLLAVYHIRNIEKAQNPNIPNNMDTPSLSNILGMINGNKLTDKAVDARGNKRGGGDWLSEAIMANVMVRGDTAWDSDGNGKIELQNSQGMNESGTFVKAMAMLPHLAQMKVNCIYLNPVNQIGEINRKSNAGSPYAIRDFFELNSDLDDPSIKTTVDDEFKAYVEAAHKQNARIMLDFVFRLVSYDNVLLVDKPQWCQWHSMGSNPKVENLAPPNKETMEAAMNEAYQEKFGHAPEKKIVQRESQTSDKSSDPNVMTWKEAGLTPKDIITKLRSHHNVEPIQAGPPDPNDPQVWSDVTFLRTMQEPNNKDIKELWNYLEDIIPYYQKKYGIDGARIDMAHNLHPDLKKRIMDKCRQIDPDFAFFAEDFSGEYNVFYAGDKKEENKLFNAACGNMHYAPTDNLGLWGTGLKYNEGGYIYDWAENKAKYSDGLIWGTPETHDSPRATANCGGLVHSKASFARQSFYPKVFPTIIGGFELGEKESKKHDTRDSVLFSYYPLKSWANPAEKNKADTQYENGEQVSDRNIVDYISRVSGIREKYMAIISDKHSGSYVPMSTDDSPIYAYGRVQMSPSKDGSRSDKALLIVQNMDPFNEQSKMVSKNGIKDMLWRLTNQNTDNVNLKLHDELTGATYDYNTSNDLFVKLKRGQTHIFTVSKAS